MNQMIEVAPMLSATSPMIVTQTIHFFSRTAPRKPTGRSSSSVMQRAYRAADGHPCHLRHRRAGGGGVAMIVTCTTTTSR